MPKGQFSVDDIASDKKGQFSTDDIQIIHPINGAEKRSPTLPDTLPEDMLVNSPPILAGIAAGAFTGGMGALPAAALTGGLMGAGSAAEQGLRKATGRNPPSSGKDFAERVGVDAALGFGSELASRGLSGILEHTIGRYLDPESLYQSALKPSGTNATKASQTVNAGIREEIPVNKAGAAIARKRYLDLNTEIENTLKAKPKNIPAARWQKNVQAKFDVLRKKWSAAGSNGQTYVKQIDEAERKFLLGQGKPRPITKQVTSMQQGTLLGPNGQPMQTPVTQTVTIPPEDMSLDKLRKRVSPLTASEAQGIKKATYEDIRTANTKAYEPGVHPKLAVRMQKDIARSMRGEVVHLFPELAGKGAREGDLIELEKQLEAFAKRENNKQKTPYFIFPAVGAMLGGGAGGATHGVQGGAEGAALGAAAAHFMRAALEDPAIKARLAIMISKSRGMPLVEATKWIAKRIPAISVEMTGKALQDRNQNPSEDEE